MEFRNKFQEPTITRDFLNSIKIFVIHQVSLFVLKIANELSTGEDVCRIA